MLGHLAGHVHPSALPIYARRLEMFSLMKLFFESREYVAGIVNASTSLIEMSFAAALPNQLNMLGHETYMAHLEKSQAMFLKMMLRDKFGISVADGELFEFYAPGCDIQTLQFALQHRCSWGCHPAC